MQSSTELISPKQVARAIGVSESTLKRWCDQGLIKTVRTAGGHRKMQIGDVMTFLRSHDQHLVSPEVLGLPAASEGAGLGLARARPLLVDALLQGQESVARQIVFDLYLARHPVCVICDQVIAAAFRDIGDRWACQTADPYQERRSCEMTLRILFELRQRQAAPNVGWTAIGGTIAGDQYHLPCAMAELVLREAGWNATSLGISLPVASLVRAVTETGPKLCWLSVSHIPPGYEFVKEFQHLSQVCRDTGTALAVGGRALGDELRQNMTYTTYCDTMQHLDSFAVTLAQTLFAKKRRNSR